MKKFILILVLCCFNSVLHAQTNFYSKTTGDLQLTSSWGINTDGTGANPVNFTTANQIFNIRNNTAPTISAAWTVSGTNSKIVTGDGVTSCNFTIPATFAVTGKIDVAAAATLTIKNATNPTLGTLNALSTVDYSGTGTQTIPVATYGNLVLSGARTGTPAITLAAGTITIATGFTQTNTGAITFTTTGNTFKYGKTTGGQTIASIPYNNLTIGNSSGVNTAAGDITVTGTFVTTNGGTLDMSSYNLSGITTLTHNGTIKTSSTGSTPIPAGKSWSGTTGRVQFAQAVGGQTIPQGTYKNLLLSNTSGTNTATGDLTITTLLTTTAGGIMDMGSFAMAGTMTTLTNNGTVQTQNTSAAPFTTGKTWTGTGAVEYNGTGAQTIVVGTYQNLKLSGTRMSTPTITLASGSIGVKGDFQAPYTGAVAFVNTGNTVNYTTTTGAHLVAGITYNDLKLSNTSGTNTADGDINVNGTLTTTSGGTFAMSTYSLLSAAAIVNAGTISTASTGATPLPAGLDWSGTTGSVRFTATAGGQFVPQGSYKTLVMANTSGSNTASGNITVSGVLTTTAGGTLDLSTFALSETGAPANSGTIQTESTSSTALPAGKSWAGNVVYNAAGGQTVSQGTYATLTLSNTSGTQTAAGAITVNTNLTTTIGGTFDLTAAYRLLMGASCVINNNGIIKTAVPTATSTTPLPTGKNWTGTVEYTAATGAQTIVAGTYNNLTTDNTSGTNAAGILVVNGTLATTEGGILNMGANLLSGTLTPAGSGTIQTQNITTAPIPAGINWGSGTIEYNKSTGAQRIVAGTYNNLLLSNTSGTMTAGGDITCNGALTVGLGVFNMSTFTLAGTLTPTINGSLTTSSVNNPAIPTGKNWTGTTGTVTYALLTGGQYVAQGTYKNLTSACTSGTNTLTGDLNVSGILTTVAGGTLDMSTFAMASVPTTITNAGTIQTQNNTSAPLPTGKSWGTGRVDYNGTGDQTIVAGTYTNMSLSGARGTNTLTLESGNIVVSGNFTVSYTGTLAFANTGNTFRYSTTTGARTIGNITYNNLTLSNTSGVNTASGNVTVNGALVTTSGGTFDMGTYTLDGTLTPTNNGTIKTQSLANPAIPSGKNWTGTTGRITYGSLTGGQTVVQGSYKNLTISNTSGTNTASGDVVISTALATTAGGTFDMGTNKLSGAFTPTNNGILQTQNTSTAPIPTGKAWAGTVEYNGTGAQTIVATTSYVNLILSGARAGTPAITLGSGTNTISVSGNFTTSYTGAVTFVNTGNTFRYTKTTGGQTIAAIPYRILNNMNTSGTNTVAGDISVSTTFTTSGGGTLNMGTYKLTGSFTPTNSGTLETQNTSTTPIPAGKVWAGTVMYDAAGGGQTIVPQTSYANLAIINSGGTNVAGAPLIVNSVFTTTSGGTLDMAANSLGGTLNTIAGGGTIKTTNTSATPIASGKSWPQMIEYYNPTGGQTIVSGNYNGGLTNSNTSGSNTASGSVNVTGNLVLSANSSLNDNGLTIGLNGNITGSGVISGGGSISMNGSGGTISSVTMQNLVLNNAGGFTLTGSPIVNNSLTLTSGNLTLGNNDLTLKAAAVIAGTPSASKMLITNGNGKVRKEFSSASSFSYPVGDAALNYTPVVVNLVSGTFGAGANVAVSTVNSKHPQNTASSEFIARYWSLATHNITSPVYNLSAKYADADVNGTEAVISMASYAGSLPWTIYDFTNAATNTLITPDVTFTSADFSGLPGLPTVSVTPTSATICPTGTVDLDATGQGYAPLVYTWAPAAGLSATTGTHVVASPTVTTTYTVTLTDGHSLTATDQSVITVVAQPSVTVTPTTVGNICPTIIETLNATPAGGTGTADYTWSGPGITSPTSSGAVATFTVIPSPAYSMIPTNAAGAYTVTLTYTGSGCQPATNTSAIVKPVLHQWEGGTSTNWNTDANWICGVTPIITDHILIPVRANQPVILASATANVLRLVVDPLVTVTMNNTSVLNIAGDFKNNGTITGTPTSNLELNGAANQALTGNGNVFNLKLNNAMGATIGTSGDTVTVKGTLTLTSGTLTTSDRLMLYSGPAGTARVATITGGAVTGNVTVQQYIPGGYRTYRFIGHPFNSYIPLTQLMTYMDITGLDGADNGFTPTYTNQPSGYWYDPTVGNQTTTPDPGWVEFTSTSPSLTANRFRRYQGIRLLMRGVKGQGLDGAAYTPSANTIRMFGTLNTGNQNVPMTKGSNVNREFNLVANPYPSPVDIGTVIKSAFDAGRLTNNKFWVWNPYTSNTGAWEFMFATGTPYYLAANESFYLRTAADGNTLNFTEANKSASVSEVLLKSVPTDYMVLHIYDSAYHPYDAAYFEFNDKATDNEEDKYDAVKPMNPEGMNFYSLSAEKQPLTLDARPFAVGKTVSLAIHTDCIQQYIIKATNPVIPQGERLYLKDKFLNKMTRIQEGTEYRFAVTNDPLSQGDNRFELKMGPESIAGTETNNDLSVSLMPNPASDDVIINFTTTGTDNVNVHVMDVQGTTIISKDLGTQKTGNTLISVKELPAGIYIVTVTSGGVKTVHKLVKE